MHVYMCTQLHRYTHRLTSLETGAVHPDDDSDEIDPDVVDTDIERGEYDR